MGVGDSNNTTNVVVAVDPAQALTVGKQKVSCLLLQARSKDKPIGVVVKNGNGGGGGGGGGGASDDAPPPPLNGEEGGARLITRHDTFSLNSRLDRGEIRVFNWW